VEYYELKQWVSAVSGLDMDALHVHVGVLAQIAAAAMLRKRLSSPWPLLALALALFANEAYDLQNEVWPTRGEQILESVKDIWNTLLLPAVLMLLVRFAPRLFCAPSVADAGEAGEERRQTGK
jgi:hypothetical protein